ncbi:ABC transporter ATP-binding protein [Halorarum salinum]|uniref:Molybdate/tungstate import ATP-binding protein WtpC n=1 Tax=Halorarum salinum TaxID=2743089 RepID=A0A7D5QI34_9EURY|nr:ABC transporter ATP-binding protein [Halobaculum salinum]QLG60325.1 ABC transporter ATP-binding protein [Halobaculum salinum]
MASLQANNVSKIYNSGKDAVKALDDVSLTIGDQEFVSIVGPSGCGKTTLLRILDGLVEPTSGEILIDGSPVVGSGQDRGMVFQSFNLFPWRTVQENIEFGLEARGDDKSERAEIAKQHIEMVGLEGFGDAYPHELSGGMQQRVGLARALAIDPEILLMDEPFGALDAQTREIMQTELLKIWGENQKTAVFVTHDIDEAIYLSDRIIVLTDRPGQINRIEDVPIERPRYNKDVHAMDAFNELHDIIWDTLMVDTEQMEVTV